MRGESSSDRRAEEGRDQTACSVSIASPYQIRTARPSDRRHLARLVQLFADEAEAGNLLRAYPEGHLAQALRERRLVLALRGELVIGAALAEVWQDQAYASHGPVAVAPGFRGRGLRSRVFDALVRLVRRRWPKASLMTLTLSHEVESVSQQRGLEAVPYCDLTTDPAFWENCDGCPHQGHLKRNQYQDCHCWAGLLLPRGVRRQKVVPKDALRRDDEPTLS